MSIFALSYLLTYVTGLAASLFANPVWGVYLYQLNYFFNPGIRWWYNYIPDLRYSFFIVASILAGWLVRSASYRGARFRDLPLTKWIVLLWVLVAATTFQAVWPEVHQSTLIAFSKLIVFLAVTYKVVDSQRRFEGLIWSYLLGGFYLGWVAYGTGRDEFGRVEGIGMVDGSDANMTASALVPAIPLLLHYLVGGSRWQRGLSLLFLVFILNGLVLLNSRGAFLGIVAGGAYFSAVVVFGRTARASLRLAYVGAVIAGALALLYVADSVFWQRMLTLEEAKVGTGRSVFWFKTFDLVRQHPLGVGAWGYQYLSSTFLPNELLSEGMRAVHSTWFQVLANFGYLGWAIFFPFLIACWGLIRRARAQVHTGGEHKTYMLGTAIESAFLGYLVCVTFIDRFYAEILWWQVLFIAIYAKLHLPAPATTEVRSARDGRRGALDPGRRAFP